LGALGSAARGQLLVLGVHGRPTRPDAPRLAKILTLLGPHLLIDLAAPLSRSLGHIDLIQDCGALVTERQERERERERKTLGFGAIKNQTGDWGLGRRGSLHRSESRQLRSRGGNKGRNKRGDRERGPDATGPVCKSRLCSWRLEATEGLRATERFVMGKK